MTNPTPSQADTIMLRVLGSVGELAQVDKHRAGLIEKRDQAIADAIAYGFTLRTIAQATALTIGRVQQIAGERGAGLSELPEKAREQRRVRRQSGALAEAIRNANMHGSAGGLAQALRDMPPLPPLAANQKSVNDPRRHR